MITTVDKSWGRDIDGNRGTTLVEHELDNGDTPEIREELFRILREDEYEYKDEVWVQLMCPISEEMIDFDVDIAEYITKAEFDSVQGE